jgi:hypothetical protein
MRSTSAVKSIGALALVLAMAANLALAGNPQVAPPNSKAYGKSLTEWMGIYWRWYYSGADLEQSKVGPVQLMPLPSSEQLYGSWTPEDPAYLKGELEITLPAGTPFVLPEFAWVGERYAQPDPGWPDDPPMDNAVALRDVSVTLTIDGKTVISDANKAAFYIPPTAFDPIVVYPQPSSYGSVAAVFYQGVGCVVLPLTPGVHVIKLYEPYIILPGDYPLFPDGYGLIYDNTWIVTVLP